MAAAGSFGLFDDPDVLTAAKWQEWLHPRGLDGRFIESASMVNVFGQDGGKRMLTDPNAKRRRAKIVGLFPEGAQVEYFDHEGNKIPPDGKNGFPPIIGIKDISKRISPAPQARARLTPMPGGNEGDGKVSAEQEFNAGFRDGMSVDDYDAAIVSFNERISAELDPSRSQASIKGTANAPMTDKEYQDHFDYVTDVTDLALGKQPGENGIGLSYDAAFKDSYGRWTQESLERMLDFSNSMYADLTEGKPTDRKAMILGGLPGSGKTAKLNALAENGTINRDDWVTIDPDAVKERMIESGWYPKIEGLTPNETAGFIHAQSSEMAGMLERMLMKDGYNVIFDSTLANTWIENHTLDLLSAHGYDTPDGVFIDSTPAHSLASIANRHRGGLEKYRTGVSGRRGDDPEIQTGGRFVPSKVVAASMAPGAGTKNLTNFERMRDRNRLGRTAVYEVSGDFVPGQIPKTELVSGSESGPDAPGAFNLGAAA